MNKKLTIYVGSLLLIAFLIIGLLISIKIDYYKPITYELKNSNIFIRLENEPHSIFINFNSKFYEAHSWTLIDDNLYVLDFSVNKEPSDKLSCYLVSKKLNCLSYIFKVVFNI